jgi:hypothetical protein
MDQRIALKLYELKIKCKLTVLQHKMVADCIQSIVGEFVPGNNETLNFGSGIEHSNGSF